MIPCRSASLASQVERDVEFALYAYSAGFGDQTLLIQGIYHGESLRARERGNMIGSSG